MHDDNRLFRARVLLMCSLMACGSHDDGDQPEDFGETSTMLFGDLGELGPLRPTVSSFVIENSGEVLIYMSSAALTCPEITVSRWLGGVESGAQVVEIVVPSELASGTTTVEEGGAEVNFAAGGRSSAYEQAASAGHVTFTKSLPGAMVEGTFSATFDDTTESVKGRFQASFCADGQGY